MADEQTEECLHCALMHALGEWGDGIDRVPVEDIIADLGEVAGHVMACAGVPVDLQDVGPLLQPLVQSTSDSFRRYSEEAKKIEQELEETSEGQTLQ